MAFIRRSMGGFDSLLKAGAKDAQNSQCKVTLTNLLRSRSVLNIVLPRDDIKEH